MTTKRKRDDAAMSAAIKSLLYITNDSQVAIHASAYGFTVTAADVAKIRNAQPFRRHEMRTSHYLPEHLAKGDVSMDEYLRRKNSEERGSAALLAKLREHHPERISG